MRMKGAAGKFSSVGNLCWVYSCRSFLQRCRVYCWTKTGLSDVYRLLMSAKVHGKPCESLCFSAGRRQIRLKYGRPID